MSVTIEQDLKEVLGQINQKLDKLDTKIDGVAKDVADVKLELTATKGELINAKTELKGQIKAVDERLSGQIKAVDERLSGQIKALDEKVSGLSKRVDSVDFINRGVFVALIIAILGGFAKIFGIVGNP